MYEIQGPIWTTTNHHNTKIMEINKDNIVLVCIHREWNNVVKSLRSVSDKSQIITLNPFSDELLKKSNIAHSSFSTAGSPSSNASASASSTDAIVDASVLTTNGFESFFTKNKNKISFVIADLPNIPSALSFTSSLEVAAFMRYCNSTEASINISAIKLSALNFNNVLIITNEEQINDVTIEAGKITTDAKKQRVYASKALNYLSSFDKALSAIVMKDVASFSESGSIINVLVLGNGGREHAIATKLAQSARVNKVFVSPGNGGTAGVGSSSSPSKKVSANQDDDEIEDMIEESDGKSNSTDIYAAQKKLSNVPEMTPNDIIEFVKENNIGMIIGPEKYLV